MKIVLASGSPRRQELLANMGLKFNISVSNEDEIFDSKDEPSQIVKKLALDKAKSVAKNQDDDALVIGADTIVVLDGKVFGKPCDTTDAIRMLNSLSGRYHEVYTGVALVKGETVYSDFAMTKVFFRNISIQEICDYVATGEPMDKAGAYGIQQKGAMLVERIEGDYFNVMGLPVCKLALMLKNKFDINCFINADEE